MRVIGFQSIHLSKNKTKTQNITETGAANIDSESL